MSDRKNLDAKPDQQGGAEGGNEALSSAAVQSSANQVRNDFLHLLSGKDGADTLVDFYAVPQRLWDFLHRLNYDGLGKIHRNEWNELRELVPEEMREFDRLINERVLIQDDNHDAKIYTKGAEVGTEKFVPEILPSEMLELTRVVTSLNQSQSKDERHVISKQLVGFLNNLFSTKLALRRQADSEKIED